MKAWSLVARIRSFFAKTIRGMRATFLSYLKKTEDRLYGKDITPRYVKHVFRVVAFLVSLAVVLFLLYILVISGLPALVKDMVNRLLQGLLGLAEAFTMIDAKELVTLVFATIIMSIGAAIVALIRGRPEAPRLPSPSIAIRDGGSYYDKESDSRIHTLIVSNYGETAALACQARITFTDIDQRDIVDIAGMSAKFTRENIESTIKSQLRWNTDSKEVTIRSGDDAKLEVLRIVSAKNGVIEHFEVPSDEGWRSITVALGPHRYYGEVRVVPMNGRFCVASFETRQDKDKRWLFISSQR